MSNIDVNTKTANFETHCANCVFAKFIDQPEKKIQIGCQMYRLDGFDKEYIVEDDKNYYKIKGICNTCRSEDWLETVPEGVTPTEHAMEEAKIQLDFIIIDMNEDSSESYNKIISTCNNILFYPKSVIIISNNKKLDYKNLYNELKTIFNNQCNFDIIQYREDIPVKERLIDIAAKKCRHTYFTIYESGEKIPTFYVTEANSILNFKLKKFVYIKPSEDYHELIHQKLYNMIGGYRDGYFEEKVEYLAKQQNMEHMILNWGEYKNDPLS